MNISAGLAGGISLVALLALTGTLAPLARAADSPAEYLIQKDRVGLIQLGISREILRDGTYDPKLMTPQFMDRHLNVVELNLPGDPRVGSSRKHLASMVVHLDGNLRDGGTVSTIDVRDPRFKVIEGMGPASRLGDIRALHPELVIRHEVIHESFDGMKTGEPLAEVHHPYAVVQGVIFQLRPANYLEYRPSDGLPDDTPVYFVRTSVFPMPESRN